MLTDDEIAHQQTLLQTYRSNLALYLRQQAIMGTAFVPPAVMHGINEARTQIAQIKQTLRANKVEVADHRDDGELAARSGATPPAQPEPTTAPTTRPPATSAIDRTRLRQTLGDRFNEEELRDLAFDLGIDYESLPGSGKAGKARELIAHVERHSRMDDLVATVRGLRPGALE